MGKISFDDAGWAHYVYCEEQDRKTLRRINQLLRSQRDETVVLSCKEHYGDK